MVFVCLFRENKRMGEEEGIKVGDIQTILNEEGRKQERSKDR